jgi:hypothetical protein
MKSSFSGVSSAKLLLLISLSLSSSSKLEPLSLSTIESGKRLEWKSLSKFFGFYRSENLFKEPSSYSSLSIFSIVLGVGKF